MKKSVFKYIVFIIYVLVVLKLTVLRESTLSEREANLMLFSDLINVYKTGTTWQFVRLFVGNIVWFAPWGFLVPAIKKSSFIVTVLSGFTFSLSVELMQFLFRKGIFEIDDLVLNTIGVMLGYCIYMLFAKIKLRR